MEKVNILGLKISKINREKALDEIKEFLKSKKFNYVVTPNPEIILSALKDEELLYIINMADLALPDGIGIKIASLLNFNPISRVTGADLTSDVLSLATEKKIKIAIVNLRGGLSTNQDIERVLKNKYPNLEFFTESISKDSREVSKEFLDFSPKVVFVNFGAPEQEKFIFHVLKKQKFIRVALGVGGSFDFLTGKRVRAPKIIRAIGLEWLWRLIIQPSRIGRIWNAVIIFSIKILIYKFWDRFFYRPNVCCLLYKKEGDKYKIFLAERVDEPGHWQLPQGGRDGENLMKAGARELKEELCCDCFIPKRAYRKVYYYKFGKQKGKISACLDDARRHSGYKGQKQGLFIAEFTGKDENISVNFWDHARFKWVDLEKLVDEVHMIRKRATLKFVHKFEEYLKTIKK